MAGGQAEAVDVEGTRAIFYNMELDSHQDTFLVHSAGKLVYFQDSLVAGDTDFLWGYGTVYYTNCELRSYGANLTQPRNPLGQRGFGFMNCHITKANAGVSSIGLGRTFGQTNAQALFANCLMDDVVTGFGDAGSTNTADYACSNLTATASKTLANSVHLTGSNPDVIAIQSALTWLYGWQPQTLPNILTNPVGLTVNFGSPATFSAFATGIPAPTYQWLHAGTNLSGATGATLTIASAALTDAGNYTVAITTTAGSVTSSPAALIVNPPPNTAPAFTSPLATTNITINAGVNLGVNCTATDSDTPTQTLTFSLLAGPAGATLDTNSGVLTWRPTVAQANSSNLVKVAVTDNGTPNLSATNSFTITVNALTTPSATSGSATYSGGQFSVSISGQVGPDYYLQANTNLSGGTWTTVMTNTPTSSPFNLTDPNASSQPMQFYRIITGPPAP